MTETKLYRHFADDVLLYVGISKDPVRRLFGGHRTAASWYNRITRVEIETFPTRAAALEAERYAIADEEPVFNIRRSRRPIGDRPRPILPGPLPDLEVVTKPPKRRPYDLDRWEEDLKTWIAARGGVGSRLGLTLIRVWNREVDAFLAAKSPA
jgi:hypothetical protein